MISHYVDSANHSFDMLELTNAYVLAGSGRY